MTKSAGMAPKVSVIMPVYNSERYVEAAAASVLSQDLDSFELIMVDDGSEDASGEICDRIAERDGRVRVFHIPNGGMCHARNFALGKARGTYVAYCDNDDEYLPGLLSANYELARQHDADCVRFGRRMETYVTEGAAPQVQDAVPAAQVTLRRDELPGRLCEVTFGTMGVWCGLYRREFLLAERIAFQEDLRRGCEDKIFNLDVLDAAEVVCLNPEVYYVWRRRAMHSSSFSLDDNYFVGFGLYLHRLDQFIVRHNLRVRDSEFCYRERVAPFREMVGAQARRETDGLADDVRFCARVRVVYDGHWDASLEDRTRPQSVVLSLIMHGRYVPAACVVSLWRAIQKGDGALGDGTQDDAGAWRDADAPGDDVQADDDGRDAAGRASVPARELRSPSQSRIMAGIVTYNPDLDCLRQSIESIVPQVNGVVVYDNSSGNAQELADFVQYDPRVTLIASDSNDGMAVALNALARHARENGAQAIVFLDQDSIATENLVAAEMRSLGGEVAMVCAKTSDRNASEEFKLPQFDRVEDVTFAITAGSLLSLDAHAAIGGYDERLFIDLVDHEVCYHLRHAGWRVVRDEQAVISQTIGEKEYAFSLPRIKRGKLVMLPYYRSNHALFRKRDMGRAFAILLYKYRGTPYVKEQLGVIARVVLRSALVEKHGARILRELWAGYCEGRRVARASEGNAPL